MMAFPQPACFLSGISLEAYADIFEQLVGPSGHAKAVPAKEHPCYKVHDLKQVTETELQ